jgi:hypothetical protein
MLFVIRFTLILIWCYLLLVSHVFLVSSKKQHRLSYHDLQRHLDSNDKFNNIFNRQFDHPQEQDYGNNPCARSLCSISNKCIRSKHRHNQTKFKPHCMCREQPCPRQTKHRKIKRKSDFVRNV